MRLCIVCKQEIDAERLEKLRRQSVSIFKDEEVLFYSTNLVGGATPVRTNVADAVYSLKRRVSPYQRA